MKTITAERIFGGAGYHKKGPSLRNPFQIDRDRIIHSSAFRRLRNKTQVFGVYTLDYYRTRLTHSLEVSQIARSIASNINHACGLNIDIDLIEAVALAHDIGHPPFGHLGEEIINDKLKTLVSGRHGFEANAQNIRILNFLEKKIYDPENKRLCGLDLTFKTIDGILKYKLPFKYSDKYRHFIYDPDEFILRHLHGDEFIKFLEENSENINKKENKKIKECFFEATRSLECQVLNAADDIAYATHDIEDGVESGLIDISGHTRIKKYLSEEKDGEDEDMKKIEENTYNFFTGLGKIFKVSNNSIPNLKRKIDLKEFFSNYISKFIINIDIEERSRFFRGSPFNDPIPGIDLSDDSYRYMLIWKNGINREIRALKKISYKLVMEHREILLNRYRAKNILGKLFDLFSDADNLRLYPDDFRELYENGFYDEYGVDGICVMCRDYISGMTDIYAVKLYSTLFETGNITELSPY